MASSKPTTKPSRSTRKPRQLSGTSSVLNHNYNPPRFSKRDEEDTDTDDEQSFYMSFVKDMLPDNSVPRRNKAPSVPKVDGIPTLAKIFGIPEQTLRTQADVALYESDRYFYKHIVSYIKNSQCHNNFKMKLRQIFEVHRKGEPNFRKKDTFRMMLWHGTKKSAIPGILQNGFARPVPKNQMYGSGIYFADRSSKSGQYCDGTTKGKLGYLFICDVELGNGMYKAKNPHNEFTQPPPKFSSVKGTGKRVPTWSQNVKYYGSIMPIGKTKDCTRFTTHNLVHNEYIVYDEKIINIVFLVEVEFS